MRKCRVTDDSDSRPLTSVGSTLGHRDRCTHIHTRVNGAEWRQEAQRIAADITKDTWIVVFLEHLIEGSIDVAVTATLTECRRARNNVGTWVEALSNLHAQGFLHHVGCQFACTGQRTVELTVNILQVGNTANDILDERLSLLNDEHFVALVQQTAHQFLRQWVLRNLQDRIRTALWEALIDIVEADTTGQNTQLAVVTFYIYIIGGTCGIFLQLRLLSGNGIVTLLGISGQQHPVGCLCVIVQRILLAWTVGQLNNRTTVSHTGGNAHQHGQTFLLGVVKGSSHHVVGLLLA